MFLDMYEKVQNCPLSGVGNRNHATLSKIGEDIRKVITLSKESMTLSKEIRDCPNQGHRLNALSDQNALYHNPSYPKIRVFTKEFFVNYPFNWKQEAAAAQQGLVA